MFRVIFVNYSQKKKLLQVYVILFVFHCNNGRTNAPHCYVIHIACLVHCYLDQFQSFRCYNWNMQSLYNILSLLVWMCDEFIFYLTENTRVFPRARIFVCYKKRMKSFEMWCWRRMEKISWTDHVRNEEVFNLESMSRGISYMK